MPRKPTQVVQLKLRIPESLRRSVEKKAKEAGRTLNGQLVKMIEAADELEDVQAHRKKLERVVESLFGIVSRIEYGVEQPTPEQKRLRALYDHYREDEFKKWLKNRQPGSRHADFDDPE
jgi:hypothetical protein